MSVFESQPQTETPLLAMLQQCAQTPSAAFHAPGHKRGQGISPALKQLLGAQVFQADLPELPELDNLFAPQEVIRSAQTLAAATFGADQTWFLVNGSSAGVVAAILATCEPNQKILLPRNVHQSAISGLILSGAVPIFVAPEYDSELDLTHSITPVGVAQALDRYPDIQAILMVYPTYFGTCGDVASIARLAHRHGIPLLVDEAHGAHFTFHAAFPTPALMAGADLTVQSTHKTLSAMTQASMLHVKGSRVDRQRLAQALQLVQSTSPSYLLLASLDAARQQMATEGQRLMAQTLRLADLARDRLKRIPGISVLMPEQATTPGFVALDRTRLTVTVSELGMDGFRADEILHTRFGVTAELPSMRHLTFILSLGNTEADIHQLVEAFRALSDLARGAVPPSLSPPIGKNTPQAALLTPRQAFFSRTEVVSIEQASNRISAELVCPYPPGIPILMPGEFITEAAIAQLQQVLEAGGMISGCADPTLQTLRVVKDEE